MTRSDIIRAIQIKRELLRRGAPDSLIDFINYTNRDYYENWHHRLICDELTRFMKDPSRKRLMLFVPPQHGKSEIVSRNLPAWILGRNPNAKVVGASYSPDLSKSFNRDIQRIIKSDDYQDIFTETKLNTRNVVTVDDEYAKNTKYFEVVNKKGSYRAVGVLTPFSGWPADVLIIDDPVKDDNEANSTTLREKVWKWFVTVGNTRLHNDSKIIVLMTRWHLDDLAGRLLKKQPDKWEVIRLPALKPAKGEHHPDDHRNPGEALWPWKHSKDRLEEAKALDLKSFRCIWQQMPRVSGGNKVKDKWFKKCHPKEVPSGITWNVWIDGAYTKKTKNDPTGFVVAGYNKTTNTVYVKHAEYDYLELPDFLKYIGPYAERHGYNLKSRVYIEPKASGHSMKQMINYLSLSDESSLKKLDAVEVESYLVAEGKESRFNVASPKIQSGKVVLVEDDWNEDFMEQFTQFPIYGMDEFVDLLGYIVEHHFEDVSKKRKLPQFF